MTLELIGTYAVIICLIVGSAFTFVGALGLLKFNAAMPRMHAPTKVGTMGIGALLLASMIHSFLFGEGSVHELLIMAFLFVTAPISANFMAKVNIHLRACKRPPDLPDSAIWATYNVPEEDRDIVEQPDAQVQKPVPSEV